MKEREKRSISYKTKHNNGDDTCIHSVACSRHSYRAERGLLMVGSELNRMPRKRGEKNERREGSLSRFFFPRQFFDRALLSKRLEQVIHSVVKPVFRRSPLNSVHENDEG